MQSFKVGGMSCGHCVRAITQAIKTLDASAEVEVDLTSGLVQVSDGLDREQVQAAIREEGYSVEPA